MSESEQIKPGDIAKNAHRLVAEVDIPMLPEVVGKINRAMGKEEFDMAEIADDVAADPVLSAIVLKVVHSPVIGMPHVRNIQQAVVILGAKRLKNLVIAAAVKNIFPDENPAVRAVWEEGGPMSYACMLLAKKSLHCDMDDAYLAGLFHDIGAMAMATRYPEYGDTYYHAQRHPLGCISLENRQYGTNHALVGSLLAKQWELPTEVCISILCHHRTPQGATLSEATRDTIAVVRLSHYIVDRALDFIESDEPEYVESLDALCDRLGIHEDLLEEIHADVMDHLADIGL